MIFKSRMFFLFLFIYSVMHTAVKIIEYCLKTDYFVTEKKIQEMQSKRWLRRNKSEVPQLSFEYFNHTTETDIGTGKSYEIQTNFTKQCPAFPPDLGPVLADKTDMELEFVEQKYPEVQLGGYYSPPNCTARHRVAIIVPYRDRQQNLPVFLNHIHPFLMKQLVEYRIFIIEQDGNSDFNHGKLANVGFAESRKNKYGGWQCFIFHDVDLLPLDSRIMYSCSKQPRHLSVSVDNIVLIYEHLVGGVSAMSLEQFTKVNGFSNKYWGWGGEDDDMFHRLKKVNCNLARYKMSIARYTMLDHKDSAANPNRFKILQTSGKFQKDGLSTLHYEVVRVVQHRLFTHIIANIDGGIPHLSSKFPSTFEMVVDYLNRFSQYI